MSKPSERPDEGGQAERPRPQPRGEGPGPAGSAGRGLRKRVGQRIERTAESAVRRQGAAYVGALEAVFALLIAIGLGYWADQGLGSAPIGLLAGVVLGFAAFVLRLVRMRALYDGSDDTGPDGETGAKTGPKDGIEGS